MEIIGRCVSGNGKRKMYMRINKAGKNFLSAHINVINTFELIGRNGRNPSVFNIKIGINISAVEPDFAVNYAKVIHMKASFY